MSNTFVFDACSLIAVLSNETGANTVKDLLQKAVHGEIKIIMHKINFLEVYYYIHKKYDEQTALKLLEYIKISPIKIDAEITDATFIMAGRLKSLYKMSLADSIGLAEAMTNDGYFVTADHHELEAVQKSEPVKMVWIR